MLFWHIFKGLGYKANQDNKLKRYSQISVLFYKTACINFKMKKSLMKYDLNKPNAVLVYNVILHFN